MFFFSWWYMKGYYSREKHPSLYQVNVNALFYTTQLQESAYFCDALKQNYQFLETLYMMMYCYSKLYEDTFHAFY